MWSQKGSPPASDAGSSHTSHDIHLPQHKQDIAVNPTLHSWSSEDYAASLAAEARQRQVRYQQAAAAQTPWAADTPMRARSSSSLGGSSTPRSAGSSGAEEGRHLLKHPPQPPTSKVTLSSFGSDPYSASLQEAAAARQQRFRAAAAGSSPFAVDEGRGGAAEAPPASAYHFHKHEPAEPTGKVGALPPSATPHPHHLHKPAELATKVTCSAHDQQQAEENCRQRLAAKEASRRRNWGTPGLLG